MKSKSTLFLALVFLFLVTFTVVPSSGQAAELAKEQHLRIAFDASDSMGWDPQKQALPTPDKSVASWIYNGLVRFKVGNMNPALIEPDLAERWETSPDGLTWTFYLRKGVQWQHGFGEFTAEDAEFSLKRAANPEVSAFAGEYGEFKEIKALDKYTLRIVLNKRIPTVLGLLTDYHGGQLMSKKAVEQYGKDYRLHPVGTGPFMVESYAPTQKTVLVAHKDYWRGKPILEKITVRYMADLSSREMAFRTGDLDITEGVREQQWIDKMRKIKGTDVDIFGPGESVFLNFNLTRKPLDDIRVRKALLYAISRDQLLKLIGKDATEVQYSVLPMNYLGGIEDVERYEYDVEKAKKLLAEAGLQDGFKLEVTITERASYRRCYEAIQEMWRKIGVTMVLKPVTHPTYHSMIRKDVNPMVIYICCRFPIGDPLLTHFFYSESIVGQPKAITNFSHYTAIDDLILAARDAEPEKQLDYWAQAQRKILADAVAYPVYVLKFIFARKPFFDYGYELESTMHLAPKITEKSKFLAH